MLQNLKIAKKNVKVEKKTLKKTQIAVKWLSTKNLNIINLYYFNPLIIGVCTLPETV